MRSTAIRADRARAARSRWRRAWSPAAIGTETDGSITCPAAINGIVGFKPTVGLVSRTHVVPISASQDTAGPMTRTVRDAALMLEAMAGSDPADPRDCRRRPQPRRLWQRLSADSLRGKRIGVMRFADGFGTDAAFEEALAVLARAGRELVEIAGSSRRSRADRPQRVHRPAARVQGTA